jgi:hypothetical protein
MHNYLKVVEQYENEEGHKRDRVLDYFFFDDTNEESLREALTKAGFVLASKTDTHLVMWRMPVICPELLRTMHYSTPCLDTWHRWETHRKTNPNTGRESRHTACNACGARP